MLLFPGTRHKLYFKASDGLWRRATLAAILEWRLDKHAEDFSIRSIDYQQKGQLIFTIEIKRDAKKLYSLEQLYNMILDFSPKAFLLIFSHAVQEFVEETIVPAMKSAMKFFLAVGLVVFAVVYAAKGE